MVQIRNLPVTKNNKPLRWRFLNSFNCPTSLIDITELRRTLLVCMEGDLLQNIDFFCDGLHYIIYMLDSLLSNFYFQVNKI